MRLNDPQIELVHDDPFMGYIETSTSSSVRAETEPPVPVPPAANNSDDEDVDVGEDSRPSPQQPALRTSVTNNNSRDGTDQSIVIVLLVE